MNISLIDAGPLIAYYNSGDDLHKEITNFLTHFRGRFVTTEAVATEVLYMLRKSKTVQNEFLTDLAKELYAIEPLGPNDFAKIALLNTKYKNVPADFADLSLIVISERLKIADIVSLDSDFNIYRTLTNKHFNRLFPL